MFTSLGVKHFPKLLIGGFLWNICRWGFGFLGPYLVNEMTDSPRLVLLAGSFLWGPMLLAGAVGGAIADRIDRRRLVVGQFVVLVPLTTAMAAAIHTVGVPVWLVYLMMAIAGVGWIIDMTGRRALIYDLVGPEHISDAMALEAISSSTGLIIGSILGGIVIGALDNGPAWFMLAVLMAAAALILSRVPALPNISPSVAPDSSSGSRSSGFAGEVAAGFRSAKANQSLLSLLGVTVLVNFFHFSYFPMTQLVASRLDTTPFLTGLLAAGTGIGMLSGALWILIRSPHRGRSYAIGVLIAFTAIIGYGSFRTYILVFASLTLSSFFIGWFSATQAALVMTVTEDAMRGRAMGLLAMSIGSLPLGMYAIGETAEQIGVTEAIVGFNITGLVLLSLWLWKHPQILSHS